MEHKGSKTLEPWLDRDCTRGPYASTRASPLPARRTEPFVHWTYTYLPAHLTCRCVSPFCRHWQKQEGERDRGAKTG